MTIAPRTQALMLAVLYGDYTDAERNEWEELCAENPTLRQELERLRATVAIINQAEKPDEEEEKFFATQWDELRSLMKPDDGLVQIALPLSESKSQLKILRLVSAPTYRWYWAAATILVAVGLSFSVYRWQERDLKIAQIQDSETIPQPKTNEEGGTSAAPSKQALNQAEGHIQGRSEDISKAAPQKQAEEYGIMPTEQPRGDQDQVKKLSQPSLKDEKNIESVPKGESQSREQENRPFEKAIESTKEIERKKADAPDENDVLEKNATEKSTKELKKQMDEAREYAPKSATPQGFDNRLHLQSVPSGAASKVAPQTAPQVAPERAPERVPLLAPASEKPSTVRALSKVKLSSTNATIRADSAQKRDARLQKK